MKSTQQEFEQRGAWLKANPPIITVSKYGISFSFRDADQARRMEQRLAVMTANQVRQLHFEIYGNSTTTATRGIRGKNGK